MELLTIGFNEYWKSVEVIKMSGAASTEYTCIIYALHPIVTCLNDSTNQKTQGA